MWRATKSSTGCLKEHAGSLRSAGATQQVYNFSLVRTGLPHDPAGALVVTGKIAGRRNVGHIALHSPGIRDSVTEGQSSMPNRQAPLQIGSNQNRLRAEAGSQRLIAKHNCQVADFALGGLKTSPLRNFHFDISGAISRGLKNTRTILADAISVRIG
jgi:hypothetical protein